MGQAETVALIARFFEALNSGDAEAVSECLHEDVVHDRHKRRSFGRQDYRFFLGERLAVFEEAIGDIAIMASGDGTRAAAEFTRRGHRRAAPGRSYSLAGGMFFAVEDGLITRITPAEAYSDPGE